MTGSTWPPAATSTRSTNLRQALDLLAARYGDAACLAGLSKCGGGFHGR